MGSLLSADERLTRGLTYAMAALLFIFLAWPLAEILVKALQGPDGQYLGLRNLRELLTEPRLLDAAWNSVLIAGRPPPWWCRRRWFSPSP